VAPASAIKSTSKACLAGTPDADRRIGYLAKYMTKSMTEAADPASDTQWAHVERLAAALAVEPCSPSLPRRGPQRSEDTRSDQPSAARLP
jgi:hypothetical protein